MSRFRFEIKKRDIMGRICNFETPHGRVVTPTLLPVINPNIELISPREMKNRFKVQMIITNSYIINKSVRLREKALTEGIHSLVDFDGPIMTDSGTFQSYVHGEIDVKPLEIVEFQRDMGVDVGTILDIFSTPDRTHAEAQDDVERTLARAREALAVKGDMALATTVQGSVYPDLREYCSGELSKIGGDFFPIGGVVPLMENYRYSDVVDIVAASKRALDMSKPVHLFGAGHPMLFAMAAALGCDFFDSSSYAKYAVGFRMMFPNCTRKLNEMDYSPCPCPVCSKYSPGELREMEKEETIRKLAEHNLHVSFAEIRSIKECISRGTLWELVEERAQSHPNLFNALLRMYSHGDLLEKFENISKKRFMVSAHVNLRRPEVARYRKRLLNRYIPIGEGPTVVLPDGNKPYHLSRSETIGKIRNECPVRIAIETPFGMTPLELDEMYPFAQSLYPRASLGRTICNGEESEPDNPNMQFETKKTLVIDRHLMDNGGDGKYNDESASREGKGEFIRYKGAETLRELGEYNERGGEREKMKDLDPDRSRVIATLDMQFGQGVGTRLIREHGNNITYKKSRKTGRIRNVFFDKTHVLSFNAENGRIILTRDGARLVHEHLPYPAYRVVIHDDAVPFAREGKSVFSRFVLHCDPEIRPGDQVLVVDEEDELVAFGKALLNGREMNDFNTGPAVNVRKGFKSEDAI